MVRCDGQHRRMQLSPLAGSSAAMVIEDDFWHSEEGRRCSLGVVSDATYVVSGNRALWSGRTLRSWADDLVEAVVVGFDPAQVILFGSVASGSDGPDSDIDLLVVFDDAPRNAGRPGSTEYEPAQSGITVYDRDAA
jgi:hypothetical protein